MKFQDKLTSALPIFCLLMLLLNCTQQKQKNKIIESENSPTKVYTTPLGLEKVYPTPSAQMLAQYEEAKNDYKKYPNKAENLIWYGRRAAYLGRYEEAITIYTEGIDKFPDNPKFYRHRGHRLISIRKYEEAITDLQRAEELIQGTENEIEADGMPNARNIPVSSLHGNIYYHLGLAYYLVHDYEKSFEAYLNCRNSSNNPDNIVSSTHWLYMIQRRLGNTEKSNTILSPVESGFDIIENHDYYTLCKLYKGTIPIDSIAVSGDTPSSDALKYGMANWFFYNNDSIRAEKMFKTMMEGKAWTSFGYLAAESDLLKYYQQ